MQITVDTSYFKTMEQIIEFQEMAEKKSMRAYMEFVAEKKLVKSWELPSDPHQVKSLLALTLPQWKAVDKVVSEGITGLFQD